MRPITDDQHAFETTTAKLVELPKLRREKMYGGLRQLQVQSLPFLGKWSSVEKFS